LFSTWLSPWIIVNRNDGKIGFDFGPVHSKDRVGFTDILLIRSELRLFRLEEFEAVATIVRMSRPEGDSSLVTSLDIGLSLSDFQVSVATISVSDMAIKICLNLKVTNF
jgi:hypothetical protein